jgi:hypothetical protein
LSAQAQQSSQPAAEGNGTQPSQSTVQEPNANSDANASANTNANANASGDGLNFGDDTNFLDGAGDFDFNLAAFDTSGFDFGMYLAELDGGDGDELGVA